MEIPRY